jgi:hypothetical protein
MLKFIRQLFNPKTKEMLSAIESKNLDSMRSLIADGAKVKAVDPRGNPLVCVAAQQGWIEGVKVLLENGASIKAISSKGETLLHSAVSIENIELCKVLLEKGADQSAVNSSGKTVLFASSNEQLLASLLALMSPSERERTLYASALLLWKTIFKSRSTASEAPEIHELLSLIQLSPDGYLADYSACWAIIGGRAELLEKLIPSGFAKRMTPVGFGMPGEAQAKISHLTLATAVYVTTDKYDGVLIEQRLKIFDVLRLAGAQDTRDLQFDIPVASIVNDCWSNDSALKQKIELFRQCGDSSKPSYEARMAAKCRLGAIGHFAKAQFLEIVAFE